MKYFCSLLALLLLSVSVNASPPPGYCDVQVCNKLERLTLSPLSYIKDQIGEQCFDSVISKDSAVVGKVLDSSTRWYQGRSINPTKKSVTKVSKVYSCN